jgi:hypothetical protein
MFQIWSTIHFQKIWSTKYTVSTKIHFFNVKVETICAGAYFGWRNRIGKKSLRWNVAFVGEGKSQERTKAYRRFFSFFCKAAEPRSESEPAKV